MNNLFGKWWFWIFIFPSILWTIGWFITTIIVAAKSKPIDDETKNNAP